MALAQKKKGGPYPKSEKEKRLEEVYRLHFEYGYSARKIAEFLNINRSTINRDIMYWFSNIVKKWRHLDPEIYVMKQIERFEIQRTRLRKQLDSAQSFHEKMTVERFIFNLDLKIVIFQVKLIETISSVQRQTVERINTQYEKDKTENRVIAYSDVLGVSEKAYEKITKIYREDRKF